MKDLVPIFQTINRNLVEFARMIHVNEDSAIKELNEHLAPEGYEFKKEGE